MAQNYTRQSAFSDGDTITATLFNDEYNQLVNTFTYSSSDASATGHRHDGSTGEGGNIYRIGDLDFLNKIEADSTNNRWGFWVEVSSIAVEQLRIQDGAIVPVTDNDIDLGTSSLEFKNLYLDGTAKVDALVVDETATITGAATLSSDLTVAGNTVLNGNTTIGNAATDTVTITADVSSNIIPSADSTYTLGDSSNYWSAGYIDAITTTGNVSVGGNLTVTGNATISGNLTFGDADTDTVSFSADVSSHILPDVDDTYDLGSSTKEWRNLYVDGTANIDSLVADTVDINGGTIDGAIIGGASAAAGTFTTANATTVDTTNIEVTNLKAKDGTAAGSIADATGVVTLASSVLTTTDINGGTIDGATIATSDITVGAGKTLDVSAGTFTVANDQISGDAINGGTATPTNLTVSGTTSLAGASTTADITFGDNAKAIFGAGSDLEIYHSGTHSIINETGTGELKIQATNLRLQSASGAENYLTADLDGAVRIYYDDAQKFQTTATGIDVTGVITTDGMTTSADITFGDNDKAVFGAGSDLQIYHTGAHSYIDDTGTGNLYLNSNGAGTIITGASETQAQFFTNGAVNLFYDNSAKLATTATGIDVTGTVTADGLTVDGNASAQTYRSSRTDGDVYIQAATDTDFVRIGTQTKPKLFNVDGSGDISFYEDTGTTPKFFWDASAESLALSNAAASSALVITKGNTTGNALEISNSGESRSLDINHNADGTGTVDDVVRIKDNGTTKFVINENYNVGIGTSSPVAALQVGRGASQASYVSIYGNNQIAASLLIGQDAAGLSRIFQNGANPITIWTNGSERMRIDSSGNLGLGVTPSAWGGSFKALQIGVGSALYNNNTANGTYLGANFYYDGSNNKYIASSSASAYGQNAGAHQWFTAPSGTAGNTVSFTQAMTLDASGNLLVGKTSSNSAVEGQEFTAAGFTNLTKDGDNVLNLNRLTSDGDIALFRKDGTTVGSIGADGGAIYIGNTAGEKFKFHNGSGGSFYPATDNNNDLGATSNRFKDLYLSGGVYLGGTGAANLLDDYETGSWTPTIEGSTGDPSYTASQASGNYTKIGRMVYVEFLIVITAVSSQGTGNVNVTGLPFTSGSTGYASNIGFTYNDTWDSNIRDGYTSGTHIQPIPNAITQGNVSFSGYTLSAGYFSGAGWYMV